MLRGVRRFHCSAQAFAEAVGQRQQLAGIGQQDAPGLGEAHRMRVAADQRSADLRLQRREVPAERRLGHAEDLRRGGNAAGIRDLNEFANLLEVVQIGHAQNV